MESSYALQLRTAALRVTAPRLAVLAVLRPGTHPTVEEIAEAARARLGSLSTQAVYDVLRMLAEAGLVRHLEPAGHPARYEVRVADNHHHLICRACGAIADVDCALGSAPCLEPAGDAGYLVDEADVTYWGWCPRCRRDPGGERPPANVPPPATEDLP
ncbi:MAG TPA: Fur family transcriptional regulator [Candidatus Dormibacteraeota bacterium]|nr:Fur family transcriptional regulator [Candidatus Dormibacteraeota bacterium]